MVSNPSTPGIRISSHAMRRRAAADLIATAHSAGLGHGLCVADDMLQDKGYRLCVADDMLQDDRNM